MIIPNNNIKINSNNPYMQLLNQNPAAKQFMPEQPKLIYETIKPIEIESIGIIENPQIQTMNNFSTNLMHQINNNVLKLLEKKHKNKKNTYHRITTAMFNQDILPIYGDFPQDKIMMIYSDGIDYFLEISNKKYPLNKKYYLKFINYILK